MKILIITCYGVEYGGCEIYTQNLINNLINRGHIVKVLSSNVYHGKIKFNDFEFKGVQKKTTLKGYLNKLFNFDSYLKTNQIIKNFKPDIIHINSLTNHGSPSILFSLNKVPTIMTLHDYTLITPMGKLLPPISSYNKNYHKYLIDNYGSFKGYIYEKIRQTLLALLLKNVDLFIAPSKSIEFNFKKKGFKNINTIYNGISLNKFSKINNMNNILYVGRLSREKGTEDLVKAIPSIIKYHPKIHLDIVGEGPEKSKLEEIIKSLRINNYVTFHGQIMNNMLSKYYRNSTLVIIPSIIDEAFSLVGLEAMSVGRPVIASNIGGIPEWLEDGKVGYLIDDPGNISQIVDKINKILSNKKQLKRMSLASHEAVNNFSIEKNVDNIEKIYFKLIKKYKYISK